MSDESDSLAALGDEIERFAREREWEQFHDPKNLVMLLASEVGELAAEFRWVPTSSADDHARGANRDWIADEVADVAIGLIMFARRTAIDLPLAIRNKLGKNAQRYPVEASRGRAERPTEYAAGRARATDFAVVDRRAALLLEAGRKLLAGPVTHVEFKGDEEARRLVNDIDDHPHAFVIACVLDRQVTFEVAWRAPYELSKRIGAFGFEELVALSEGDWRRLMTQPTALHRFPAEMAKNVHAALHRIAAQFGGDASAIWRGRPSSQELISRFLGFRGVGPKIASMAANILVRHYKVPLSDYNSIDISADVHVRRVFGRLGLTEKDPTTDSVIARARALHPEFPGLMDLPAWDIGHNWCRPERPKCSDCYMSTVCAHSRSQGA